MRLFVKRDLDGFFGLFVDNLVQLLSIVFFCVTYCGMQGDDAGYLFDVILPGTALSVLAGNLFYAWQAQRLARREGRDDVTALPYGINTPSLIVYVFFVLMPEYQRTGSVQAAWQLGLVACLGSGLIELAGAAVAGWIRQHTPRAALLSTLAGIAIGFISMTFALQIFQKPLIALLPLAIVLVGLFARVPFPAGLPAGLVAVVVGTLSAWGVTLLSSAVEVPGWLSFGGLSVDSVQESLRQIGPRIPVWCGDDIAAVLEDPKRWIPLLSVIVPMGLFNVVGSLQNIESAEAAGDRFPTASSMTVNGLGTIVAALFGSCFPTTIYIGHPGWKALGARAGYSTLNGIAIVALCLLGLVQFVASVVPIEAGAAIVLWIGIIITAQSFQATPDNHAPAVAVGLFPAIAAWGATVMMGALTVANGTPLQELIQPTASQVAESNEADQSNAASEEMSEDQIASASDSEPANDQPPVASGKPTVEVNGFLVHGLLLMERGYIFTCMFLAAACACLIDRRFVAAAVWMFASAALTFLGAMHAYQVYGGVVLDYLFRFSSPVSGAYSYRADDIALAYLACGIFFLIVGRWARQKPESAGH